VINVAQSGFDFVVADLDSNCSSEWAPVLRLARVIVLVAETNVPSLWSLERQLSLLRSLGISSQRFQIVINRWHRADEEPLEAFEKRVKVPIFARLPNDFKQVSKAVNMGTALSRGHNDQLVSKFRNMAEQIAGVRPESAGKHGTILSLFSSKS
jgi:Flp pilus assembly CpaE family ATPase